MTTGIALVGAAVVVANPLVTAPHDVSVPSVRLSAGAGAAHGMFDKALVDAIAVGSDDSTSPGAVLRQLFASLAADVFGGTPASGMVPQDPADTPSPSQPSAAAPSVSAASATPVDTSALANLMQPVVQAPAVAAGQIGPELQQALTVVTADTSYLGQQVVAAAIAAAGLTVTEPALITQVVTALANGDVTGAVNKVIAAAQASLRPTSILLDAVRTLAASGTQQVPTVATVPSPRSVSRAARQAAVAQDGSSASAVSTNGATDVSDGNKVTPQNLATSQSQTHSNFAVGEQIRTAVANFGAAVRKLAGLRPRAATTAASDATN